MSWFDDQVAALIALGDDPLDAEKIVRAAMARTPEGADVDTFLPVDELVWITKEDVQDARADWYVNAPHPYKRLLDARTASSA